MPTKTGSGRYRKTDRQKHADLNATRTKGQRNALKLINALHEIGFRTLWLESQQVTGDGQYFIRVIVDSVELNNQDFNKLLMMADAMEAKVMLTAIRMNQQEFSRITLWPQHR